METWTSTLPQALKIIEEIRSSLRDHYGALFRGLVLYGSYARGDHDPESDIDLLVLLSDELDLNNERPTVSRQVHEVCDRVSLNSVLVSPMVARETEYQRGKTPFHLNVKREGISFAPGGRIDMQPEIDELLERARRELKVTRLLVEREFHEQAISRAYYAMFYAAEAALLSRGVARSRHSGVIAAFNEYFVSTGLLPDIPPGALPGAFDQRNQADYGNEAVSVEQARVLLEDAERFVEAVDGLLKSQSD